MAEGPDVDVEIPQVPPELPPVLRPDAQAVFDRAIVLGAIEQTRQNLASAKFNWELAKAGHIPGGKGHDLHPNKFRDQVWEQSELLEHLLAIMDRTELLPEPIALEVSKLEVPKLIVAGEDE